VNETIGVAMKISIASREGSMNAKKVRCGI
jgi:hypothetical protein